MERELAAENPTQRQMAQQRHDREWLKNYLPQLERLTAHIPEFEAVIAAFRVLAARQ